MSAEKKYWQINTDKLAKEIREAAHKATTEEDLKMSVEPLLQNVFTQIGVDVDMVQYEKAATRFQGRADTVYGYVTIEYKVPGKLSGKANAQKVSEQLQRYLSEQAKAVGQLAEDFLEKAVGIALDGEQILFVRFTKVAVLLQTPVPIEGAQQLLIPEIGAERGFQVLGPFPVSSSSISNLLIFIRASARRPLTAKDLATVFSPSCEIARQAVSELYFEVIKAPRRHARPRSHFLLNSFTHSVTISGNFSTTS